MNKKIVITFFILILALFLSNGYWLLHVKNIRIKQEQNNVIQAEKYAKRLEFQMELTKSSIQTVTEETNHYMYINEKLQEDNNALQQNIDALLVNDKCANSDIPSDVRKRMYTK